jgi:DNA-binding SARP family transcriptional activator
MRRGPPVAIRLGPRGSAGFRKHRDPRCTDSPDRPGYRRWLSAQGRDFDLGPHKQRSLPALLLVHAHRVVSTDQILDELWGDDTQGKENALWVYVSRLRSVLEPNRVERGESSVLLTRDHGYLLSVDPDSIDAHRFEAAAAEGRTLIRNDAAGASEILTAALDLWRGSAFQDFAYDDFARTEISRLDELRLTAVGDRIEADLRRGRAGELVGELEALQQRFPMQERFVSQLMLALYRSGRQADALRRARIRGEPVQGSASLPRERQQRVFGRDRLVADVVRRLDRGERLIGLVGPSGSGKSRMVRTGLIPALRKGAITGSDGWLIAQMVPGSRPFVELEVALLRSSLDAPDSLSEQLAAPETGMLQGALRMLPGDDSRLLLVIDQFEELFTLTRDEVERSPFLANLLPVLEDPHGRVMVVLTLRADFYDRPLAYPEFGVRMGDGVVNVVSLTPDELEEAAQKPAQLAGVSFEPALLAALLTDVVGRPGALPLFQYTLTELFNRRVGDTLTLDSYRAMDGVSGALTRRADGLYSELDAGQQAAAEQLYLRLVTISDSDEWGRRRVPASEIVSLDVDVVDLQGVIALYTEHRLLTLDRDFVTGSPTVEVAHEALLTQRAVDPDIEILASYASAAGPEGFARDDLAGAAAASQYQQGADVVYHVAGDAGIGIFEAAREQSDLQGKHLWAIGVDSDQYLDVDPSLRRHVLTSMVKRFDSYVYDTIKDFVDGKIEPGIEVLTLADGALDFSTSGDHLPVEVVSAVRRFKQDIVSGTRGVPVVPTGPVDPPPEVEEFIIATVTYDGTECRYQGPQTFRPGQTVRFDFANATQAHAYLMVQTETFDGINFGVRRSDENSGLFTIATDSRYTIRCGPEWGNYNVAIEGSTFTVKDG